MKIVHILTVSDSLVFLRGQPTFLKSHGVDMIVVTSPGGSLEDFSAREEVRAIGVPIARKISPISDLVSIWKLVRVLRAERPDIVHAHTPKGGLLGTIASRLARVPVTIYHIRGLPYMGASGITRTLLKLAEKTSFALADVVFSVSRSIAEVAIKDNLLNQKKVRLFHKGSGNGIDAKSAFNPSLMSVDDRLELRREFGIAEDALVCLFVGRITGDKGIYELAQAWEVVSEAHPDAVLVLVGSQDERLPLDVRTLKKLQEMPTVVLAGQQQQTALFYAAADIVVLPSHREGLGMVLIEAAAMEKPTIATRIPGCVDAIEDGVTGDLVAVKDYRALAAAINALIDDPTRREAYGKAGRQRVVEYFDSRIIWEAMLAEYHRLAEHRA